MKLLVVSTAAIKTPPDAYGGMEREVNWLVKGLRELGHEVDVLCKSGSTIDNAIWGDSEHDFVKAIEPAIADYSVIIDFSHDKLVTRSFDLPQINCYQVMTVSHPLCPVFISKAQREHCKMPDAPVVYYGLDQTEYPLYEGPRDDYILFVGSLIQEKRVHWVAELAELTGFRAVIRGPKWQPEYWPTLDEIAEWDSVRLLDEVGGQEKLELIQRARCLVHPVGDKNWVEAGAIIVLEALLCGTPVVTSTNGCLPEYVMDGMNGYTCNTVQEMAHAIQKIDLIPPRRCRLSVAGKFSYQRMAKDYAQLIDRVVAGERW